MFITPKKCFRYILEKTLKKLHIFENPFFSRLNTSAIELF